MSTPSKSHHRYGNHHHRPRRHTITRPDSALALLSDFDDDDDDDGNNDRDSIDDDQDSGNEETFDRISDILNNLLQEANDAVKRDHHQIEEYEEYEEEYEDVMEDKNQTNTQDNNEMQQQPPPPIQAPPSTRPNKQTPPSRLPRSRIRPSTLLVQQQQQNHTRGSSISSSTSSSSSSTSSFCLDNNNNNNNDQQPLFSPLSPTSSSLATSPTASIGPSSPVPMEYPNNKQSVATIVKKPYRQRPSVRPLSCPTLAIQRRPTTSTINSRPMSRRASATQTLLRDPLIESYKRLDSSMALVESLSRDLASLEKESDDDENLSTLASSSSQKTTTTTTTTMFLHHDNNYTHNSSSSHQQQHYAALTAARKLLATARNENQQQSSSMVDPRLSALLILPLLHIPHTLISMVFESMSTTEPHHLTGMIAWAFFFAFANVMVDRVVISTSRPVQWLTCRLSVPGAYDNDSTSSSTPTNDTSLSYKDISNTSKVTSPTTPTRGQICFQRRSGRRVILPRRSSVYRKIQQRPSPLLHDAMRHGGSGCSSMCTLDQQQQQQYAALAITRSRTQPGYNNNNNAYYYNTTTTPQSPLSIAPTATTSSLRPMIHRRNSF